MTAELPLPEQEESILIQRKSSRPKAIAIAAGLILLTGGLASAFWISKTNNAFDISEYTVPVESEVLTLRITASGKIVPFQSVNLSPKTAGILVRLNAEQGDRVSQGQLLAQMDDSNLKGQAMQAQATLIQSQARYEELKAGSRKQEIAQAAARAERARFELEEQKLNKPDRINELTAQFGDAQAQVNLAKQRLERYTTLVEKGAATQDRLDESKKNYDSAVFQLQQSKNRLEREKVRADADVARAQASVFETMEALKLLQAGARPEVLEQAQAEILRAQGQIEDLKIRIDDTKIRAPFDGIITQKYATEGAFVTPTTSASSTSSATSTSIVALARGLEIIAEVPEVDVGQIKQNQLVDIRADAFPDQIFKGRVRLIAPEAIVEQNVTSFQVRIAIQTGLDKLRSGMNTDLTFLGETVRDALVVPTVAIATQKGQTGVYVAGEDNKPEFRPITIGSSFQEKTQVLEGLTQRTKVFIDFPEGQEPEEPEE